MLNFSAAIHRAEHPAFLKWSPDFLAIFSPFHLNRFCLLSHSIFGFDARPSVSVISSIPYALKSYSLMGHRRNICASDFFLVCQTHSSNCYFTFPFLELTPASQVNSSKTEILILLFYFPGIFFF